MTAETLREILIEKKRDIKLDELPEIIEYLKVFNELFEVIKEEAFKTKILKKIYGDKLYKLLHAIDQPDEKGGAE